MAFRQKITRQLRDKENERVQPSRKSARVQDHQEQTKEQTKKQSQEDKVIFPSSLKSDREGPLYDLLSRKQPARTQLNTEARKGLGLRNTLNQKTIWTY